MFPTGIYFCSRNGYVAYYRLQRSCGKVIFSQASIILSTGGVCQTPPGQTPPVQTSPSLPRQPSSWADTLWAGTPPRQTATAADGTHPTGMHYYS